MIIENNDIAIENKLTSSIVNLEYLNECFNGDSEISAQVIDIFLKQADEIINRLKEGVQNKDYKEITYTSHFFKTSFTTMGVNCLENVYEIETLSRNHEPIERISDALNRMLPSYNEAIEEYETILKKLTTF